MWNLPFFNFLYFCCEITTNKFVKIVRNDFASLLRRPVKVKDTSYNVDSKSTQQKSLRVNLFSVCMISAIHTTHYFFSKKHKNQKAKFQVDFFAFALKKDEIREKSIQIESNRLDSTRPMSFSFFKPSRPKTPVEVAKAIRDSLTALDTKTVVEVKALEKVCLNNFD